MRQGLRSWKLNPAEEGVLVHLPNGPALDIDGAQLAEALLSGRA